MRELPIPFSAPMVRAIMEGRKTMTRRIVKPQPMDDAEGRWTYIASSTAAGEDGMFSYGVPHPHGQTFTDRGRERAQLFKCPYGQPGDRLWVREAWRVPASLDDLSGKKIAEKCLDAGYRKPWCPIRYEADCALNSREDWRDFGSTPGSATPGRYRHARFMPRWASRITLEVTGVRVERLQEISEADAAAEGAPFELAQIDSVRLGATASHRSGFIRVWETINGAGSWDANHWVWVVEFKRMDAGHG